MLRFALAVGLLVVGLAVGVASVAVHATWWGLPLAVLTTTLTAYAAPAGWGSRLPLVLGWAVAVGVLAVPRAEGDVVIEGNAAGYTLLVLGLVLVVAGFATLPRPRENASSVVASS